MRLHIIAAAFGLTVAGAALAQDANDATGATQAANAAVLESLPFEDRGSFENARRGFIAPLPGDVITGANGAPIWDPAKFDFLQENADAPATVNPSLWRQSQLVNIGGLFEVASGIYQIRNYDLSNMTVIEGDKGITVVDPLVSAETAKAALDLYYANRGEKPVKAVIYTHSHADHFGGVRGVVDEADVAAGKVKIYAPEGFMEHAIAENVLAGNAMARRASYQFGNLLPPDPRGQVGSGLGTTTAAGTITLIPPTDYISKDGHRETIDGQVYEFMMANGSGAPSEFVFYMPELKVLNMAETATHMLHNTYTLRGAKVRDPLEWSKYLNAAINRWGDKVEILYNQHQWPVWGNAKAVRHLKLQRDMYRFIHDETLRLANHGYTMTEIAEMIDLPDAIEKSFSNRGYYGTFNHNVKATYMLYLGWFDGNPANLNPLPPVETAKRYVEVMGGADAVLEHGRKAYEAGDYRWVAQLVNNVVYADPGNQAARDLQADTLEQLGYQAESGVWRNFYLSAAKELRHGIAELPAPNAVTPDTLRAMSLDLYFDYMAVRLNHPKADGRKITLNFVFPDLDKTYLLELENGVLNHSEGSRSDQADTTITLDRATLDAITLQQTTMQEAVQAGKVSVEGDPAKLQEVMSLLDTFGFWFNIATPNPAPVQ
ncbi:alkyl sulfatase dimerization domain-containing protein [Paracoccus onubensis]|uniref:alkyl/aryl-sulfatase n=1 Tax=Paracoccus onubensis TaxID=1675788 RepID=UPI0027305E41|nr:alkyl sulfatase dimerization domain-containing protein [Paracoccus onubensis]MDP0927879.1 alkyl sulfatase dimerization domain-containing protein [Paracoccus onubensis]